LRVTTEQFYFTNEHLRLLSHVTTPLTRGWGFYNCCWSSPAQSFSGQSPAGLMTKFYCLRFKNPPTWRPRPPYLYPTGTGWPCYTPRHWVPFSSPLRLVGLCKTRVTYQECVFIVSLYSNGCPFIVESVTSGICLQSRCLAMIKRHNITLLFHTESLVFPSALKKLENYTIL
jgi:hypothetical protein